MNVKHWLKMALKKLGRWLGLVAKPAPLPKPGPVVPIPGPTPQPVPSEPVPSPLPRLRPQGRYWVAGGVRVPWRSVTAFRLLEMVAHDREGEAVAFLKWAASSGVRIVRVLAMKGRGGAMGDLFGLTPAEGLAALPRLLTLAEREGLYCQVVVLADTAHYRVDYPQHVEAVGMVCLHHSNAVVELQNENGHPTQDSALTPAKLRNLRRLIPAEVPVALGAAADDESEDMAAGADWLAVHSSRADGENGWRFVRHSKEMWDRAINTGLPVVNNEPARGDLGTDKQFALGVLMSLLGIGDCFHYGGGLHARIPEGDELAAFHARRNGWLLIGEWEGLYYPVEQSGALRVYSSRAGDVGWAIGLDCGPDVQWKVDGYRATLAAEVGRCRVWRLTR